MAQVIGKANQAVLSFETGDLAKEVHSYSASGASIGSSAGVRRTGLNLYYGAITGSTSEGRYIRPGGFSDTDASLTTVSIQVAKLVVAFYVRFTSFPSSAGDEIFWDCYGDFSGRLRLTIDQSGNCKLKDNSLTHTVGTLSTQTWHRIWVSTNTIGAVDKLSVSLDGTYVFTNNTANFGSTSVWNEIYLGHKSALTNSAWEAQFDDYLMADRDLVSDHNIPDLDDYQIVLQEASSDGNYTDWYKKGETSDTSDDYMEVNDVSVGLPLPDDASTYLYASETYHGVGDAHTSRFSVGSVLSSGDTVFGIVHWSRSGWLTNFFFGDGGFKQRLRINSTDYDDHEAIDSGRGSGWQTRGDIFWDNPDDSAAWEYADLNNSVELGIVVSQLNSIYTTQHKISTSYMLIIRDVPSSVGVPLFDHHYRTRRA